VAHLSNRVLDFSEESNFLIEDLKRRITGNNAIKNLFRHIVEVKNFFFNAGLFTIFTSASTFEFLAEDLLKR
jgi:hypothetical protein